MKGQKKRHQWLAVLLALSMVFCISPAVFAEETTLGSEDPMIEEPEEIITEEDLAVSTEEDTEVEREISGYLFSQEDIEAEGFAYVDTEANLKSALNNGEIHTIVLMEEIPLSATLTVKRDVTIDGDGNILSLVSGKNVRHFTITSGNVTIKNLTIKGHGNGNNGGGISASNATLTVTEHAVITGNRTTAFTGGGGIYATNSTILITDGTQISENTAANGMGGGIYAQSSSVIIDGGACVYQNTAPSGGGIYIGLSTDLVITGNDTAIEDNTASNNDGGGIYIGGTSSLPASLTVTDGAVIKKNTAKKTGGGIVSYNYPCQITIEKGAAVSENHATESRGGGIHTDYGILHVLEGAYVTENTAIRSDGGGISAANGQVLISESTVAKNTAGNANTMPFGGGGIYMKNGTVQVTDNSLVSENYAYKGGGIFIEGSATERSYLTITKGAEISENTTSRIEGGGVLARLANVIVSEGAIVCENTAKGRGGGISMEGDASNTVELMIDGAVIANNYAGLTGGGIYAPNTATVTILSSIIKENEAVVESGAGGQGGGIYAGNQLAIKESVIRDNLAVTGNNAGGNGGGVYVGNLSDLKAEKVTFSGNRTAWAYLWTLEDPATPGSDSELHNQNILDCTFTGGFSNAYNNYDVNYTSGTNKKYYFLSFYLTKDEIYHQDMLEGSDVTVKPSEPERYGYAFQDWYEDQDFQTPHIFGIPISSHLNLYAKWTPNSYTVTYYKDNGLTEIHDTEAVDYGELATGPLALPNKTGYTFAGWYQSEDDEVYDFNIQVSGDLDLYARWAPNPHIVTYYMNNNSTEVYTTENVYYDGIAAGPGSDPVRDGYTFLGWYTDNSMAQEYSFLEPITGDLDLYAGWEIAKKSGGSGGKTSYGITYYPNNGINQSSKKEIGKTAGVKITIQANTFEAEEHSTFLEWNTKKDGTGTAYKPGEQIAMPKGNLDLYAIWKKEVLSTTDFETHAAYISGYPDGNIRPDGYLTRAEAASIFYRILNHDSHAQSGTNKQFTDVSPETWYYETISYVSASGLISGEADGRFRPEETITRAEFTAIAVRYAGAQYEGTNLFTDIKEHWAAEFINTSGSKGWITGYKEGTFKPERSITRAEAVTILNRILGRENSLVNSKAVFSDLDQSHWAYSQLLEAAIEHQYQLDDSGIEQWLAK